MYSFVRDHDYHHHPVFDFPAGAVASSTSVLPPDIWLAARIADLTSDLQIFSLYGTTVVVLRISCLLIKIIYHMTIILFSEIAHVINNVMTRCVLTPAQRPIGYCNEPHNYLYNYACE